MSFRFDFLLGSLRFVHYDSEHLACLGMAHLKVIARPIGSEDIEPSEEERRQLSEGEEDLTNVTLILRS